MNMRTPASAIAITTILLSMSCKSRTVPSGTSLEFITVDTANRMISSYLNSINAANNDTDLRSVIINADEMRSYLADTSIKDFKIMLAHTQAFINSGKKDQNSGYRSNALTFIIAGVNRNGNYVYFNEDNTNKVLDRGRHCPTNCPAGNASSPIFPTSSESR